MCELVWGELGTFVCSLLGPGDIAVELPRPGQTGPLPRRKAPGIPSKIQLV
jgi:hypothetical protein